MLLFFLLLCHAVGVYSARKNLVPLREWYPHLQRSPLEPPGPVFGRVWLVLYTLMAVAGARVWADPLALGLFLLHLGLNLSWSYWFFQRRQPARALLINLALWITLSLCILRFAHCDPLAAALMLPQLAWLSFAIFLNFEVCRRNRLWR